MRAHAAARLLGQRDEAMHHRRVAGVEAAGDVRRADDLDERRVVADGIGAPALGDVGVEVDLQGHGRVSAERHPHRGGRRWNRTIFGTIDAAAGRVASSLGSSRRRALPPFGAPPCRRNGRDRVDAATPRDYRLYANVRRRPGVPPSSERKEESMPAKRHPPFRADHVGSLLRPTELKTALEGHQQGKVSAAELRAIEDRSIRDVVKLQEETGIPVVTDGEFRRYEFHTPILTKIQGVELTGRVEFHFHYDDQDIEYAPPILEVTGKLGHPPGGLTVEDFKFTKALTNRTVKICLPSPTYMYARGGWA